MLLSVLLASAALAQLAPQDPFVEVDAVYEGVCARRASGQVVCVGDEATTDLPRVVDAVTDATALTAGANTCAVLRSGSIGCWGKARAPATLTDVVSLAELGRDDWLCAARKNGSVVWWDPRTEPTLKKIAKLSQVVQLSGAPGGETCARTRRGRVLCAPFHKPDSWSEVLGVQEARQIDAGSDLSCALVAGGKVMCWGLEWRDGKPFEVEGLTNVVHISAGRETACAVRSSGEVVCWGSCSAGQCGLGNSRTDVPLKVPGVDGALTVSVGMKRTCAVRRQGDVVCWGNLLRNAAAPVSGLESVVDVIASHNSTCARRADGSIRCWGEAHWNGENITQPATVPVEVKGVGLQKNLSFASREIWAAVCQRGKDLRCRRLIMGNERVISGVVDPSIVDLASPEDGCAISNGGVWCWGGGGAGLGTVESSARIEGLTDAIAVASTGNGACAIRKGGAVVCWGSNGYLLATDADKKASAKPVPIPNIKDAVELSARDSTACARLRSGKVACWGSYEGRVEEVEGLTDAVQLNVGWMAACAVRQGGRVVCWKASSLAELRGTQLDQTPLFEVPGLADAVTVTVGNSHACARTRMNRVVCWGNNDLGQLGDGAGAGRPVVVFE